MHSCTQRLLIYRALNGGLFSWQGLREAMPQGDLRPLRPEKICNLGSQVELNLEEASEPDQVSQPRHWSSLPRVYSKPCTSSLAPLTPALFSFIISGVQIKPQEEGETSLPVGKLIRIWEIMLQIKAFFSDLSHSLRQNTLDSIQALHHSDYSRLR